MSNNYVAEPAPEFKSDVGYPAITIFAKGDGPLTKSISLPLGAGKPVSDATACKMSRGAYRRLEAPDADALARIIDSLERKHALALGIPKPGLPSEGAITAKDRGGEGIARTKANFVFEPGRPAWALIDFDQTGMPDAMRVGNLWEALCKAVPGLAGVERVERASTSAGLRNSDTREAYAGSGGAHIYLRIADGADCDRFLKTLSMRLWLAGFGWHLISIRGSYLVRSLVDVAVCDAARLVFEGPPDLHEPLTQDARPAIPTTGDTLDTRIACPDLTADEKARLDELLAASKDKLKSEHETKRKAWIVKRGGEIRAANPKFDPAEAQTLAEHCADTDTLLPDVVLYFDDPSLNGATVGDVLADPAKFHGKSLADPIEPDEPCKAKFFANENGTPIINSFLHGGTKYRLVSDPRSLLNVYWWADGRRLSNDEVREYKIWRGLPDDKLRAMLGYAPGEFDGVVNTAPQYQSAPQHEGQRKVILKNAVGVDAVKIDWLWRGWLARGKFHVLGGQKGAGKSTMVFDLFATITRGGKWPDGTQAPIGDVLVWSGEDDFEDTILPRFLAAGGDKARLYRITTAVVDGQPCAFDPAYHMPALLDAVRELPNLLAIMIDPIVLASNADSHKNAETRRGLQPLVDLARDTSVALIGITHFTKNTQGRDPIERITGTLAYGALPRVVWGAVKSDDELAPRKLVRIASNIGQGGGGFEYELRQALLASYDFSAQRVEWGRLLTGSARELLETEAEPRKIDNAEAFLVRLLGEAGTSGMAVDDVRKAAEAHSITPATLRRAKDKLGRVMAFQRPGATNGWCWRLAEPGGV